MLVRTLLGLRLWLALLALLVAEPKSFCSKSDTLSPRRAASRATPAPWMPPPMMIRSQRSSNLDQRPARLLCGLGTDKLDVLRVAWIFRFTLHVSRPTFHLTQSSRDYT